ncbi:MAG: histidine phosphatase family protein [Thermodesulfovibrionales bacterium]
MVTTLFLIRHGATEGSETRSYKGSIDVPLSGKGIEQVRRTAAFLDSYVRTAVPEQRKSYLRDIHASGGDAVPADEAPALTAVYCSDLSRSKKSAEIVAAPHGLGAIEMKELRERSFGRWEGMSFLEIRERFPEEFGNWSRDPLFYSPPGGESTLAVRDRVMKGLEQILAMHQGECFAIVAHGGVNRIILCEVLGMPLDNIFRIEQDHAALNVIEFWDRHPVVRQMNYLPGGGC